MLRLLLFVSMAAPRMAKRVAQESSTGTMWGEILAMGRAPGVINLGQLGSLTVEGRRDTITILTLK